MNKPKSKHIAYNIPESELKEIQKIQMDLISEVDRICKKNDIKYNMVGGTMLGAIRHKGYIPWDDDADIGFLRENYEKFLKACEKDLDKDRFFVQDFRLTPGYRWGYGKLRRKNTEFIRLDQEHMPYEQAISIDLMPFDNVPEKGLKQKIHFFRCFIYRKAFWSEIGRHSDKSKGMRVIYGILYILTNTWIFKSYEKFINTCRKKDSNLVRILTFPTPKGIYGYNRKWYEELSDYEFGKLVLPGATDYDGYLKVKYGNYMELPPIEKRKVHPISKLKLL